MHFGNGEAAVTIAEMIRDQEGIGKLLSEGTQAWPAKRLTRNAEQKPINGRCKPKGLETAGYDGRGLKTFSLGSAVGMRGPATTEPQPMTRISKVRWTAFQWMIRAANWPRDTEEYAAVYDTLPLCKFIRRCFTGKADRAGAWPTIANLINATTGWDFKYEDIDLIGERAHTIKKAFNIREGWKREDDTLPYRWMHDPMTKGPSAGHVTSDEELEYMKDLYYKAKGWTQ